MTETPSSDPQSRAARSQAGDHVPLSDQPDRVTRSDTYGPGASHELLPLVYDELRALARANMSHEAPGRTLQATALVHEAYLRLGEAGWNGRGHFFGAAARAMRRILVEQARRRGRIKRGGDRDRIDLDVAEPVIEVPFEDVLAVDDAVTKLQGVDERKAAIVELRWFAGLSNQETAEALSVSVGTVEREWRFIRPWLQQELAGG